MKNKKHQNRTGSDGNNRLFMTFLYIIVELTNYSAFYVELLIRCT